MCNKKSNTNIYKTKKNPRQLTVNKKYHTQLYMLNKYNMQHKNA